MNPILTVDELFEAQAASLKLRWLAGRSGRERLLEPATARFPGMALVGYLNYVHPNRVQVLGSGEVDYLRKLPATERRMTNRSLNNSICRTRPSAAASIAAKASGRANGSSRR